MEAWSLGPNMLSAAVRGGEAAADFSANVILDQYGRFSVAVKISSGLTLCPVSTCATSVRFSQSSERRWFP
jgi:hypothetical protein